MKDSNEPGPVTGASRYNHLVSTAPCTSVSRSKFADVPFEATPTVVRLPGWLEALKLPAPLVKSSSTAHTPLTRPISPVIVNTSRSREYQPLSLSQVMSISGGDCPAWLLAYDAFLYTLVTKSTRPLMLTFGAGVWAEEEVGPSADPSKARIAQTRRARDLMIGSSIVELGS